MPLTPLDIYNKEFRRVLRGYSEDEVNEFLDQVVKDYEAVLRENEELKAGAAAAGERLEQYRQLEETLKNTLVLAQSTADEVKVAARKEADAIIHEAEGKAQRILEEAQAQVRALEQELERLKREADVFRAKLKSLLESEIALLDSGLDAGTAPVGPAAQPVDQPVA
ncbi:cell-division initiation protein [Candidatus Hydrogenisulfobacillus filiaventi]|uniref:Cell-division initiation protein n=1 Tax=Candidatus Hydrogenisulfobacillus filiaventi TaxID=2707344 RepID=A0A6F8ZG93_9FIRM|nr:DivIVA domain-containing protein [Bacillota bacterium]CAB1128482.1 cell-division initiation protein [Candidatus Hydrogenisulfobacillus filiaventi]